MRQEVSPRDMRFKSIKKKSNRSGQGMLLHMIMRHFGGPTKLAKRLQEALNDDSIGRQLFVNWARRGHVPLVKALLVGKALKVSPYALNYREVSVQKGEKPTWESVVNGVMFLRDEDRKDIFKAVPPK